MSRRNNDSFYDNGPPNICTAGHGSITPTQRSGETTHGYTHHTRHSTVRPASYNSQQTINSEKAVLYDPYDPGSSSDSEVEPSKGREDHHRHRVIGQSCGLSTGYQGSASVAGHHDGLNWDLSYSRSGTRHEQSSHGSRHDQSSHDHSARPLPTTETPLFPRNAYGGRRGNGRELSTTTVPDKEQTRSPPGFTQSNWITNPNHRQSDSSGRVGDQIKSPPEVTKKRSRSPNEDLSRDFYTCEMCNLNFQKAGMLGMHLKCNSHWETLEHIQNQNNYNDTAIAFLHEAMLIKVQRGDRPQMNRQSLRALLDKDYMTRIEIFHCASCQVYVSVHPSSLQDHLSSKDHLRNKMELRTKQLKESVNFAKATMKRMKNEYASFREGKYPFEQSS
ncbi:hypothetical protein J4Q44_G00184870 [Coregonus suidteri]|uniref:DBIRD complex subunit ZNF326 n=1 Tax=Coregonus suidteri TaxID=861788 RepID=A0AAN8R2W1_9TELE